MNVDVLIFVEDPGAANYVQPFPEMLSGRGLKVKLLSQGIAGDYLNRLRVDSERVPLGEDAAAILERYSPKVLLVGTAENPRTIGLRLVDSARGYDIVSVGVVDAGINAEYRFRGTSTEPLRFAPDWLLVPDRWTANRFTKLGYQKERLVVCGHPRYDYVRSVLKEWQKRDVDNLRTTLFPGWSKGRPIWLFASEISTGFEPGQFRHSSEYTLQGSGRYTERTKIVLEEFLGSLSELAERPYLVLRLHPKNTVDEFSEFIKHFDYISKDEDVLEVICGSDLVVGMTSMLLVEAVLMRRATLSILPRPLEKEWLASTRAGVTPYFFTRDELTSAIRNRRVPYPPESSKVADAFVEGSSDRILAFLTGILEKHRS